MINLLKGYNRICAALCIFVAALLAPTCVFAEESTTYQLTIKYPLEDVQVSIYRVADYTEQEAFVLEDTYAAYEDNVTGLHDLEVNPEKFLADDWRSLAKTLGQISLTDNLDNAYSLVTEETNGTSISVERGLYLVCPAAKETGDAFYAVDPAFAMVPYLNEEGKWNNEITLDFSGKVSDQNSKESYRVEKIWKDDGSVNRPKSIEVTLKKDYTIEYDTVVLNADNNWRYTWTGLPRGHQWTVVEKHIPEGYKVSYDAGETVMYIKNTGGSPGENPPGELANTGLLWWPVPILSVLGLLFFAAGWVRYNYGERR